MTEVRFEKRDINYLVTRYVNGNYEKQVILEDKKQVEAMIIASCKKRKISRKEYEFTMEAMKLFKCKALNIKDK